MPSNLLLTKIGTAILQLAARVGATGGSGYVRPKDRGRQTVGPSVMPSPLRCTLRSSGYSAPEALTLVNSSVVCADRGALTAYLVDDHGTYLESVWASVHRHDITMTAAAENELENERGGADGCAGKTFLSQVSRSTWTTHQPRKAPTSRCSTCRRPRPARDRRRRSSRSTPESTTGLDPS